MADDVLITSNHMQKQAERIKLILDSAGKWKLDGNIASVGYKYKNADRDGLMLKGIKAIDGLAVAGQSITVNSSAYDSDTQVTISGEGYDFTLADTASVMINSPNTNLTAGAANSSICLTSGAANSSICLTSGAAKSSVFSDGNCYIDNAAPSVYIRGNFGNDTILNTGEDVYVRTGAEGSSSISDYGFSYYDLNGNGDTVYIDESLDYIFANEIPAENAAPMLFFGDKTTGKTMWIGNWASDRLYVNRAKNLTLISGGGYDSITVGAEVENCTIIGGGGNDYITIDSGSAGNVYSIASGQGSDSVLGWNAAKDTLQIGSAIQGLYMINQGNDLGIMFNEGGILLVGVGVGNTCTADTTILIKNGETGEVTPTVLPYRMDGNPTDDFGGTRDLIINTDQTPAGGSRSTLRNGNENKPLTISAGGNNDTIINEGSYVYIDGGAGTDYITVTGGSKNCSIDGGASSDYIYIDNASGVYVDGSVSLDNITITGGANKCTIANGSSNLRVFTNNTSGNIYSVSGGSGVVSIFGYKAEDTILIDGASYSQSVNTSGYNYICYEGDTSKRIALKGALAEGKVVGSSVAADYEPLAVATRLNISVKSGDKYVDRSTFAIFGGTAYADTMNITVDNAIVSLGGGNDSVTVSASNASINALTGSDAIWLESPATNCTIFGGASNDSIFNNSNGNIFYYTGSSAEGTDSLSAFNSNDLIYINDSDCTVTDSIVNGNARLQITKGTTNTYILMIGKTTGDTVRIKLGADGAIQTYTIGTGF